MTDELNTSADSNYNITDDNQGLDGQKIFQYSLYIFNGIGALIGSGLIISVILSRRALHSKDYYLLAGLAGECDDLAGFRPSPSPPCPSPRLKPPERRGPPK